MVSEDGLALALAARRLMRRLDRATLATSARDGVAGDKAGWPYPSFVLTALDYDGTPLLFISGLAQHTRNILEDDRVGLSFEATAGLDEPLTGPRVSVLGRAARSDAPHHRRRFLARHPSTERLTQLGDFAFFKVTVERAHLVAGFGRARWLTADALLSPNASGCQSGGQPDCEVIEAECLARFGDRFGKWRLTGVDSDGCDLRAGAMVTRADFPNGPVSPDAWRDETEAMIRANLIY